MKRRVVITGMGTVNPLANNVEDSWKKVQEGACGIGPITHFDTTDFVIKLAGEVKDLDTEEILGKKEAKHMDRYTQLAMIGSNERQRAGYGEGRCIQMRLYRFCRDRWSVYHRVREQKGYGERI